MTTPICNRTLVGAVAVILLAGLAYPVNPFVAASFQAGVIVGLLLHSSHVKEAEENGWVETDPP